MGQMFLKSNSSLYNVRYSERSQVNKEYNKRLLLKNDYYVEITFHAPKLKLN
jgi:hypothetical protein